MAERDAMTEGIGASELTPRGRRTREALIKAARTIFERDGFNAARITDIADEASVAHGTFYTYFDSKEAIFLAVSEGLIGEFLDPAGAVPRQAAAEDLYGAIEQANHHYLESYLRNGRLMVIWEDMPGVSPGLTKLLTDTRHTFVARTERAIRRLQQRGAADKDLDPYYAATALCGMVQQFAYNWISDNEDFDLDQAVAQLTRLWANAIGLDVPARRASR